MLTRFLIILLLLSGCAATDSNRMYEIERDFRIFASDCNLMGGELRIDIPFNKRRVHNEPITVWEKTKAICYYADASPRRIYYDY